MVQKCICDLSSTVDPSKLETQPQEFEVLAKNKDGLDPGNYVARILSDYIAGRATYLLATVDNDKGKAAYWQQ